MGTLREKRAFFADGVGYNRENRVRILHMSSARRFGDAERHLACLCRELSKRGHEIFVALRPTNQWQNVLDFLPPQNLLYVSVRNSFGMLSVRQIARFIDDQGIDVLHAHGAKDYLAASVIRRSSRRTGLVLTRHVDRPLKPFHRLALRNVDAAIAVSPEIREHLALTFPTDRIFTIINGIPCDDRAAEAAIATAKEFRRFHEIDSAAPVVAAVGELKVSNGQRDLVLAANEIVTRFPDCRFIIAGSDPSIDRKFRRELKRLVKVLGLERQFIWLETLEETSSVVAAANIMVSLTHNGMLAPAVLEAVAAGVAVISTATDDVIGRDDAIPAKDPLALSQFIIRYLEDGGLRKRAVGRLQSAVREKFGVARMTDETEAVYRDLRSRT